MSSSSRQLLREAVDLGYWIVRPGSKHWLLRHSRTGYTTILPYGTRASARSERNIRSALRRGARPKGGLS